VTSVARLIRWRCQIWTLVQVMLVDGVWKIYLNEMNIVIPV